MFADLMEEHPMAAGQMLLALDFYLGPTPELVIVAGSDAQATARVLDRSSPALLAEQARGHAAVAYPVAGAGGLVCRQRTVWSCATGFASARRSQI